jgi:hypothetical protein
LDALRYRAISVSENGAIVGKRTNTRENKAKHGACVCPRHSLFARSDNLSSGRK